MAKAFIKGATIALAATGLIATTTDGDLPKKIEYIMDNMDDAMIVEYNDEENSVVTSRSRRNDFCQYYVKESYAYVAMKDWKENGYGQIDYMEAYHRGNDADYIVENPSKELLELAQPYFERGIDGSVEALKNDKWEFEGPDQSPLLKKVMEEGYEVPVTKK